MAKRPAKKKAPKRKPSINSRQKGAQGEREFAELLREWGFEAKRGQQHAGGVDSPDVLVPGMTGVHWEVKRVQAGNPYNWMAQAKRDGVGKLPIVAHRKNNCDWLAVLPMEVLLELLILREGTLL